MGALLYGFRLAMRVHTIYCCAAGLVALVRALLRT
jgi:hypothetical protein